MYELSSIIYKQPIVKNATYNCFDNNIIAPIIKAYSGVIYPYFLTNLYVKIDKNNKYSHYRLGTGNAYTKTLLKDFYGIEFKYFNTSSLQPEQVADKIRSEFMLGKVIGIVADSYNCPWNRKYYKKVHMEHVFLVLSLTSDGTQINCIDGFFSDKPENVSMKLLQSIAMEFIIIDKTDCNIKKTLNILPHYVLNSLTVEPVDRLVELMEYARLLDEMNFESELQKIEHDIRKSDIIFNVSNVENARRNYLQSLEYFRDNDLLQLPEPIYYNLKQVILKWNQAKSCIIQGFLLHNQFKIFLAAENIRKIAVGEVSLYEQLVSHLCHQIKE